MIGRQKRLHEAYEHLRKFFGIHTQTDFAEVLKYSRVYISSALNGNEKNLTDKLFTNICEAFPGVFNLDYLLTGEGDLLTIEEDVHTSDVEQGNTIPAGTANILDMCAHVLRLVDDLRTSLKDELEEVKAIKAELQQARDDYRQAAALMRRLANNIDNYGGAIAADK
jgi:transcriptional regulator with XRE-family HTH domain